VINLKLSFNISLPGLKLNLAVLSTSKLLRIFKPSLVLQRDSFIIRGSRRELTSLAFKVLNSALFLSKFTFKVVIILAKVLVLSFEFFSFTLILLERSNHSSTFIEDYKVVSGKSSSLGDYILLFQLRPFCGLVVRGDIPEDRKVVVIFRKN
jgi:hypothetical protein